MKLNQLLVISIAAFVAVAAFNSVSSFKRQPSIPLEIVSAHGLWAHTYGKVYSSPEEQSFRLAIFHETASRINAHNSNPDKTYTQGLNQFSDMTDEEFRVKFGMPEMTPEDIDAFNSLPVAYESKSELLQDPVSVDWRSAGIIPPVLNQGKCGSCWAFSAASVAEA